MKKTELDDDGLETLFENLKYGDYIFGKFRIRITKYPSMSGAERTKLYFERDPTRIERRKKLRRDVYKKRKEAGICVKCGKNALKNKTMCEPCRKNHLDRQKRK